MNFLRLYALLSGAALMACGCATLTKPSPGDRQQAIANGKAHWGDRAMALTSATFFLITDDEEIPKEAFQIGERSFRIEDHAFRRGLAFAFDPRGYLLTAKHCVGEYVYLIGLHRGRVALFQPEVVFVSGASPDVEFAVLKVPAELESSLESEETVLVGENVAATLIGSGDAEVMTVASGTTVAVRSLSDDNPTKLIETTIPLWRGDSGGPLLNEAGRVIGINSRGEWELQWFWPKTEVRRISFQPDFAKIRRIIDEHSARNRPLRSS